MKALSWVLLFWPLFFAIFIIIATELTEPPVNHSATPEKTAHAVVVSGDMQQVADTVHVSMKSLAGEPAVRP